MVRLNIAAMLTAARPLATGFLNPASVFRNTHRSFVRESAAAVQNKKLAVILRGLPGSGKSSLASRIVSRHPGSVICSADNFFVKRGEYKFDISKLSLAHNACMATFCSGLKNRAPVVVVDNTNTMKWEFANYLSVAAILHNEYEAVVVEFTCYNLAQAQVWGERSTHGVSPPKIKAMFNRFESFPGCITIEQLERKLDLIQEQPQEQQ